jgi:2-iminobutanoate/2-iminopropanoate deaminase
MKSKMSHDQAAPHIDTPLVPASLRGLFPMKTVVQTPNAPAAVGPYSQAIAVGNFLFCAGQIPLDPATGNLIEGDVTAQTTRVLENVKGVLGANGMTFADVVKATVFLADMNDFAAMNAVYGQYFAAPFPARSTIQVARLPKDAKVEIEVIAAKA